MSKQKIKRMVGIALLMGMVIVLQFVSSSIPPIGGLVSISLVLIPIVLGAATYGVGCGAFLGATFGVVVVINCITGADPGGAMVFQANPALCVAVVIGKGVLAGLLSGLVYKAIAKKNSKYAMLFAAIVCPVVNTGTFLTCMALFFREVLTTWANSAGAANVIVYVFSILLLCNFVPELLINVIFSPAGQRILQVVKK
jgi:uncharacterized membrane protein